MEKIKDIKIFRDYKIPTVADPTMGGVIRISATFVLPIPQDLKGDANIDLVESYKNLFSIETMSEDKEYLHFHAEINTNIFVNGNQSLGLIGSEQIKLLLVGAYNEYEGKLLQFQLMPFDAIINKSWDGTTWNNQIVTLTP